MTDATSAVSPLRRRMIDDMTLRNLSPATQRSYLHAVAKFSRYFNCSPDRLGLEDVRAFQVYLVSQGISWPALNQTVCALRFFYGVTLNQAEPGLCGRQIAAARNVPPWHWPAGSAWSCTECGWTEQSSASPGKRQWHCGKRCNRARPAVMKPEPNTGGIGRT